MEYQIERSRLSVGARCSLHEDLHIHGTQAARTESGSSPIQCDSMAAQLNSPRLIA